MTTKTVPHFFPMASCELRGENGTQLCLYYQNPDGTICEHRTEPNGTLITSVVVRKERSVLPNTPIAVTYCHIPYHPEIHLFYLDKDFNICKCYWTTEGWSEYRTIRINGAPITAAPYSQLAATCYTVVEWDRVYKLIVYFQDTELNLREVLYDPSTECWSYGHNSIRRVILAGSCLAAGIISSRPHMVWCFFQKPDTTFYEVIWYRGSYISGGYDPYQYNYRPGSSVSCVLYGPYNIRIYNITTDNYITETFWDGHIWSETNIVNNTRTTANSSITVVRCGGGETSDPGDLSLRIFYQVGNQQIHELALDGGVWRDRGLFVDNSLVPRAEGPCQRLIAAD